MNIILYATAICLIAFVILATYDGLYLHLWKFELFRIKESKFEHKTHTIRAILFPAMVWLLFLNEDSTSFWIGLIFVFVDLIVLGIDAYSEKDSRKFMGGLPRWEYIVHLFANGFHFAAISLMVSFRVVLYYAGSDAQLIASEFSHDFLRIVVENTLPGGIMLGLLHVVLITSFGQRGWSTLRSKVRCC